MGTQRSTHRLTRHTLGAFLLLLLLAATGAAAQQAPGQEAAAAGTPRPRVTVIGTGGTMAGVSTTRTSFQTYRAGQVPIADMVYTLKPQIDEVADVSTVQFGNAGSGSYRIVDYYDLTLAIDKALETADAVVVTTGTGTMDEFVYWADLTVRSQKPVVFTGAMRPWTVIGSDAPANLFNAIVLAASRATTCFGSVLMLNDEFHAGKDAWKSDELRLDTFVSRQVGALGTVDGLRVRTFRAPPRIQRCATPESWRTPFDLRTISREQLPRVEVLIGYQGAGLDEAVAAWADAGVKGIVVSGGGVSTGARRAAEEKGVTFATTYRFRTGGNNLYPEKARLLLLLSLAFSNDSAQVTRWLTELGGDEFEPTLPPG
jgi:L-asparaginase